MSRIIPGCYDMDYVELFWIFWIIVVIILIKKCTKKNRQKTLLLLCIIVLYFRVPFLYGILTFSALLSGNIECHACNTRFLYNKLLQPKFLGNKLPEKPTIIICNYPSSYVEYLTNHLLNSKICILLYEKAVIQNIIISYFYTKDAILLIGKGNQFAETQKKVRDKLTEGYSVLVYPEKHFFLRKSKYDVTSFHSGIFNIAKNIDATITPIVFDHIDHNMGLVLNNNFKIYIDRTRKIDNVEWEMDNVTKLFKRKLSFFSIKL